LEAAALQFPLNGDRPAFAQSAGFLELLAQLHNAIFDPWGSGAGGAATAAGLIRPIDPIQALALSPGDPDLDGAQTDPKLARHGAQRLAATHGGHYGSAVLFRAVFRS